MEIQVLQSRAGYYIGQLEDGEPFSRLSMSYYPSREECYTAMKCGFPVRYWSENEKIVINLLSSGRLIFVSSIGEDMVVRVP